MSCTLIRCMKIFSSILFDVETFLKSSSMVKAHCFRLLFWFLISCWYLVFWPFRSTSPPHCSCNKRCGDLPSGSSNIINHKLYAQMHSNFVFRWSLDMLAPVSGCQLCPILHSWLGSILVPPSIGFSSVIPVVAISSRGSSNNTINIPNC